MITNIPQFLEAHKYLEEFFATPITKERLRNDYLLRLYIAKLKKFSEELLSSIEAIEFEHKMASLIEAADRVNQNRPETDKRTLRVYYGTDENGIEKWEAITDED
jgi:hypothetical protein